MPSLRPALLLSLAVLALLVTCAALDGPVVRYRYPADPLIALVGAGALTWVVGCGSHLRRLGGGSSLADRSSRRRAGPARA